MTYENRQIMEEGGGFTYLAKRFDLTCTEILMLNLLIRFDHPVNGCHPSQERLMYETGRLQQSVVSKALKGLEEKGLIDREKKPYRDTKSRKWRPGKQHHYILSEEIDRALQIASETFELRLKANQTSLFDDAPIDDNTHLSARFVPDNAPIDDNRNVSARGISLFDGAPIDDNTHLSARFVPDNAPIDDNRNVSARRYIPIVISERGGGGGPNIDPIDNNNYTDHPPPLPPPQNEAAQALSMQILCHPDIAMPPAYAALFAAQVPPHILLAHAVIYNKERSADEVKGIGVLIYRFQNRIPARTLTEQEEWSSLYEEFAYAISLLEQETQAQEAAPTAKTARLNQGERHDKHGTGEPTA